MMNDSFVARQARSLAARATREAGEGGDAIGRAYRIVLGRSPTEAERARAAELAETNGLDDVAWMLLNASEFLWIE